MGKQSSLVFISDMEPADGPISIISGKGDSRNRLLRGKRFLGERDQISRKLTNVVIACVG